MGKAEHTVEGYLQRQAKKRGMLTYKFVSPSSNGVPDQIVIAHGVVVFCEVKSPRGKLSGLQIKTIEKMRNHGANIAVVYSKEQVDELLDIMEGDTNGKAVKASIGTGTREKEPPKQGGA